MVKWKAVPGYVGLYEASTLGQIRNKPKLGRTRSAILDPYMRRGYLWIELWKNGVPKTEFLHRVIAKTFLKKVPGKDQINHKNGVKYDNRIENLEWCTNHENVLHARETGLSPKAYPAKYPDKTLLARYNRQVKVVQFGEDGQPVAIFATIKEAAMATNVVASTILKSVNNPNYRCGGYFWDAYSGEPLHCTRGMAAADGKRELGCLFGVGI